MSKKNINNSKRIQVSFTESQWILINKFKGEFGDTDADIIRNIVMAWLAEKVLLQKL